MPGTGHDRDSIRRGWSGRRAWWVAWGSYGLGALLATGFMAVTQHPAAVNAGVRIAWKFGPWSDSPIPFEREAWLGGDDSEPLNLVAVLALFALAELIAIAVIHTLTWLAVVGGHACRGWPPYWAEVRPAIRLWRAWAESARRSWWVWPSVLGVWGGWAFIHQCTWGSGFHVVITSWPFLLAHLVVVVLGFGWQCGRVLRSHVLSAVTPELRRCFGCGYRLRGLDGLRCPECGRREMDGSEPAFGYRSDRARWRRASRQAVLILLVPALLLAPGYALPLCSVLPPTWVQSIPRAFGPLTYMQTFNPNAFPIRFDAICTIRHEGAIAVVKFERQGVSKPRYTVGYWQKGADPKGPPTERRVASEIFAGNTTLQFGPWKFSASDASETFFWLYRPDATYTVECNTVDQYPGDLSWVGPGD